jgi:hypothetical protein
MDISFLIGKLSEGFVKTICPRVNSHTLEDPGIGGGGISEMLSSELLLMYMISCSVG